MEKILILDFGSQFTQLIARRLRELQVYCEIYPCHASMKDIQMFNANGIILSGGPFSVYDKSAPKCKDLWTLKVPVLGICYGMQYMAHSFGGKVIAAKKREYGRTYVKISSESVLFRGINGGFHTWMSHGDEIGSLPQGFVMTAVSENHSPAAMENRKEKLYAVQFHPEVLHTEHGTEILRNFAFDVCHLQGQWTMASFLKQQLDVIRQTVGEKGKAICALSGGVDSSVAAVLVQQALGDRLTCLFIDNGLLRHGEAEQVMKVYKDHLHLNVKYIDAKKEFLSKLKGVSDPEKKRKIIGKTFIQIFEKHSKGAQFLVQGTLYPDVIESCPPPRSVQTSGPKGFSSTIKSHHNVGGLPKNMKLKLIEPLRELFKDEVRAVGADLSIPSLILQRHPFPGPGLAVRVLGAVTEQKLAILRAVDFVFIEEIKNAGLYSHIWQAFAVFLPMRSVGVMGDGRTYEYVVALRAVTSSDGMTADWYAFDPAFLARVSNRIVNEVKGVSRVVYDISSKPPATIEWE